jgi:hypothetical protein
MERAAPLALDGSRCHIATTETRATQTTMPWTSVRTLQYPVQLPIVQPTSTAPHAHKVYTPWRLPWYAVDGMPNAVATSTEPRRYICSVPGVYPLVY